MHFRVINEQHQNNRMMTKGYIERIPSSEYQTTAASREQSHLHMSKTGRRGTGFEKKGRRHKSFFAAQKKKEQNKKS